MVKSQQRLRLMNEDRISELPDHIRQKIISLLPPHEALATTVLSRQWRDVWITLPHLDLGRNLFNPVYSKRQEEDANNVLSEMANLGYDLPENRVPFGMASTFLDFVDRTLARRRRWPLMSAPLLRLDLFVPWSFVSLSNRVFPHLDRWFDFVVDHNHQLRDLTFSKEYRFKDDAYELSCKAFVGAHILKRLSLTEVKLNSDIIDCLATNCPLLERLCLEHCCRPYAFKVSGLLNLTEFVITEHYYHQAHRLEIHAPSLRVFDYECLYLREHCMISLNGCDNLKCLRILNGVLLLNGNQALLSKLECLELSCSLDPNTTELVISSDCLKSLCLGRLFDLSSVKVNAPNLKEFAYHGTRDDLSVELKFVALEKAIVHPRRHWNDGQLFDFLAKLHPSESLEMQIDDFEHKDMRIIQRSQAKASNRLYNVKHLTLTYIEHYDTSWWPELWKTVDSLLWLCPHPDTISMFIIDISGYKKRPMLPQPDGLKVLKFKYNEGEDFASACDDCRHLPKPCWKHHVKEVTIENPIEDCGSCPEAEVDDMIKAFFENARNGKKIIVNTIN